MNDDEVGTAALASQGLVVPTVFVVKRSILKATRFDSIHYGAVITALLCTNATIAGIAGGEAYWRYMLPLALLGLALLLYVRPKLKQHRAIRKMLGTSDATCRLVHNQLLIGDGETPTIFPLSKRDVAAYTIAALPSARIVHGG